jgi:hypothetical protein
MSCLHRGIALLVSCLALAPPGSAACTGADNADAQSYARGLFRMWAWEEYWNVGARRWNYEPSTRAVLAIFWNSKALGFCSNDLQYCASYELVGGRLGQPLAEERLRGVEELNLGTQHFIAAHRPKSVNWVQGEPKVCEISVNLPELQLPAYWDRRRDPSDLPDVVELLKAMYSESGKAGTAADIVLPIYDPADPELFVLVRPREGPTSVLFFVHNRLKPGWELGGHFDHEESPEQLRIFSAIIVRNILTTIAVK